MPLMIWGPMFEVGVDQIDTQHHRLFNLANELADAVRENKGMLPLGNILNELTTYTQTHFALEEKLMSLHGYPATVEHKICHQELVKKVDDFKRAFLAGDPTIVDSAVRFFTEWLSKHIMEVDKAFARDLIKKGLT
ncbi:MAG: bacteriohemerythrin [Trichlorobacter sp.]|uniref:bacteriohemerythrin n=1 Tax=Trichlorobacter sp. TaxID=2911007 RepID=UPI002561A152|nr:bacteriohemerythrin [Trichlorobacter sp.]MDK9716541.1 bacteriohemerythrin [Trichlorobacter sp.]